MNARFIEIAPEPRKRRRSHTAAQLQILRIAGYASVEQLAEVVGSPTHVLREELDRLARTWSS